MGDILAFPADETDPATDLAHEHFLLDEGLELLSDFRSIEDRRVRDSLRTLVKSMALAGRANAQSS